jgi:hypothetical protein
VRPSGPPGAAIRAARSAAIRSRRVRPRAARCGHQGRQVRPKGRRVQPSGPPGAAIRAAGAAIRAARCGHQGRQVRPSGPPAIRAAAIRAAGCGHQGRQVRPSGPPGAAIRAARVRPGAARCGHLGRRVRPGRGATKRFDLVAVRHLPAGRQTYVGSGRRVQPKGRRVRPSGPPTVELVGQVGHSSYQ